MSVLGQAGTALFGPPPPPDPSVGAVSGSLGALQDQKQANIFEARQRPQQAGGLQDILDQHPSDLGRSALSTRERIEAMLFGQGLPELLNKIEYKKYSDEKFDDMTKEPIIKDILPGSYKMTKEQAKDRIKEHLDRLVLV